MKTYHSKEIPLKEVKPGDLLLNRASEFVEVHCVFVRGREILFTLKNGHREHADMDNKIQALVLFER